MAHTNNNPISLHNIEKRSAELIDNLMDIWDASVRASHDFLTDDDISEIRECLPNSCKRRK